MLVGTFIREVNMSLRHDCTQILLRSLFLLHYLQYAHVHVYALVVSVLLQESSFYIHVHISYASLPSFHAQEAQEALDALLDRTISRLLTFTTSTHPGRVTIEDLLTHAEKARNIQK